MALKPFDGRLGPEPPQGKVHFVHVKDPPVTAGPELDVEQAEQPTRQKRRQHIVEMIAQAVVEGEDAPAGAGPPSVQRIKASRSTKPWSLAKSSSWRSKSARLDRGSTEGRPPPAARSDTSPASRPTLSRSNEDVLERANALDRHFDFVGGILDGAHADRGAAGDVGRPAESYVLRDEADDLAGGRIMSLTG